MTVKFTELTWTDKTGPTSPSVGEYWLGVLDLFEQPLTLVDTADDDSVTTDWQRVTLDAETGVGNALQPATLTPTLNIAGATAVVKKVVNGKNVEQWRVEIPEPRYVDDDPDNDQIPYNLFALPRLNGGNPQYGVIAVVDEDPDLITQQISRGRLHTYADGLRTVLDGLREDVDQAATDITDLDADLGDVKANLTAEETARIAADNALVLGISNEAGARIGADSAEATARAAADTAEAATRAAAVSTLTTNLAAEVTNRTNADTTLQTNITNEATARAGADTTLTTNLASEAASRTSADTALGLRIDLQAVGAADTFNRSNSSSSLGSTTAGQLWTVPFGTWGVIDSQAYSPNPGSATWAVVLTNRWNVDIQANITLGTQASSEAGLTVRYVDSQDHIHVALTLVDATSTSIVRIVRHIAGVGVTIASADYELAHGTLYRLRVVAVDREIQVIVDDEFVVGAVLSDDEFALLGTSGLRAGLYMGLLDTTSRIDQLVIQDIPTIDKYFTGAVIQDFEYASTIDDITDLKARIAYPIGRRYLPVLVVMHDYTNIMGYFTDAILNRLTDYGLTVLVVALRGRDSGGGAADGVGREVYDIKDAVDALRAQFPRIAHRTYQALADYGSGTGFAAAVKLPDLFSAIISFWSPSDIGKDATFGWYQERSAIRATLEAQIGGTPTSAPGSYAGRDHRAAAGNYTGGLLTTYHDKQNVVVPYDQSYRFTDAMTSAGLTNFDKNESDTADGAARYLQQAPADGTGAALSETDWIPDIVARTVDPWTIPDTGTLRVEGFLAAKAVEIWLAGGLGTADEATFAYDVTGRDFTVTMLGSDYIDAYKIVVPNLTPDTPAAADINGTTYTETADSSGVARYYYNVFDWQVGPFRFANAEAAPITLPHTESGAYGKLAGSDPNSKYIITGGKLTGTHQAAFSNPYVYIYDLDDTTFERVPGYSLYLSDTSLVKAGYSNDADAFSTIRSGFQLFANNDWRVLQNGTAIGPMAAIPSASTYEWLFVLGDFGGTTFIKGGTYTNWTLLWAENFNDNANANRVSPGKFVINHSGNLSADNIIARHFGGAWSRFALHSDTFHIRPILPQAGTGRVDGFASFNYDFYTGDVLNFYFHYTDLNNTWILRLTQSSNLMEIREKVSGVETLIGLAAAPVLSATGGTSRISLRWQGARIDALCSGTNTARINISTATGAQLSNGGWSFPDQNTSTLPVQRVTRFRIMPLTIPGNTLPTKTGLHGQNVWHIGDSKTVGSTDTAVAGGLSGYGFRYRHLWAAGQGSGSHARPNQLAQGGIQVSNITDPDFTTNLPDALAAATDTPDICLINLTVNDSALTSIEKDAWKVTFQTEIIDAIHSQFPNAKLYLARVWHRGNPTGDDELNTRIDELIDENPGVCFAGIDERTFLPYTYDFNDSTWHYDPAGTYAPVGHTVEPATVEGIHPGRLGYIRTAEEWYLAVTGDTLTYDGY